MKRSGLLILGASGDALKGQTLVVRIERVDTAKLKSTVGKYGGAIDLALDFADWKPSAAIDIAVPIVRKQLADIGIDTTVSAGAVPPRGSSEFWGGLAVGGVLGGSALAIWKLVGRLVGGRK